MIKILALSDSHGTLPELNLDGIDLVLHAGDWTYRSRKNYIGQLKDFDNNILPWIENIRGQGVDVYWTLGNHETFYQKKHIPIDIKERMINNGLLLHTGIMPEKYNNLLIWGFPFTNGFKKWGFNVDDTPEDMGRLCQQIPTGTDILISHGPTYGINDLVDYPHHIHAGSKELSRRVDEIKPKLFLSGHLHCDRNYGIVKRGKTTYVGCSLADEMYQFDRDPIFIEMEI